MHAIIGGTHIREDISLSSQFKIVLSKIHQNGNKNKNKEKRNSEFGVPIAIGRRLEDLFCRRVQTSLRYFAPSEPLRLIDDLKTNRVKRWIKFSEKKKRIKPRTHSRSVSDSHSIHAESQERELPFQKPLLTTLSKALQKPAQPLRRFFFVDFRRSR